MTSFIDFVPSVSRPFQFTATLDSAAYIITVPWNTYGQRYYVVITTLGGGLVGSMACKGSPLDYDLSLSAPFGFTTKLVFRTQNSQFEVIG